MVQVLERAFDIIEHLAENTGEPVPLGLIAAHTDLHPATCARILKTLCARSYVEQVRARGGYALGPMAYTLTDGTSYRKLLVHVAEAPIRDLSEHLRESTVLTVLNEGRRFTLFQADGTRAVQISREVLCERSPYHRATGRLLLAHLPRQTRERIIDRIGLPGNAWPEASSVQAMHHLLDELRQRDRVEVLTSDVAALACPVWERGSVAAALGVYLPAARFIGTHRNHVQTRLRETADAITQAMILPPGGIHRHPQPA